MIIDLGRIDRAAATDRVAATDQTDQAVVTGQTDRAATGRIDQEMETGPTDQAAATGLTDLVVAATDQTDRETETGPTAQAAATGRIDRETETGLGGRTDQAAAMTIDPGAIDRASDRRTDQTSAIGLAAETVLASIDRAPATGRPSTFSDRPSGRRWDGCGRRCGRPGTAGGIAVTGADFSTATTKPGCAEAGPGATDRGSGRWGPLARAGCCRRR